MPSNKGIATPGADGTDRLAADLDIPAPCLRLRLLAENEERGCAQDLADARAEDVPDCERRLAAAQAALALARAVPQMATALTDLRAFVAVMIGRGPYCIIPETVPTPLGIPVQARRIMDDAEIALRAAGVTP